MFPKLCFVDEVQQWFSGYKRGSKTHDQKKREGQSDDKIAVTIHYHDNQLEKSRENRVGYTYKNQVVAVCRNF